MDDQQLPSIEKINEQGASGASEDTTAIKPQGDLSKEDPNLAKMQPEWNKYQENQAQAMAPTEGVMETIKPNKKSKTGKIALAIGTGSAATLVGGSVGFTLFFS